MEKEPSGCVGDEDSRTGRGNPGGDAGCALAAPGGADTGTVVDTTHGGGPASTGGASRGSDASRGGGWWCKSWQWWKSWCKS
jgi:hypothetical protein